MRKTLAFAATVLPLILCAQSSHFGGLRSFAIVPLETVSETSSNASVGDLNGDGHLDIVLVKGRHWQLPTLIFFGDGKGHFKPGPPLPTRSVKSYSARLADMTRNGRLDIVLSNDAPDPKLVLLNDGYGHFSVGGTYGDPKWETRNVAVGDLNGDGYPDVVAANRGMTSYVCLNAAKRPLHFDCSPLPNSPSSATVLIADIDGDGAADIVYACRDDCQSVVFFNDGHAGFSRMAKWGPAKGSVRAVAVGDFNGDGRPDIAACHEHSGCSIYFNRGNRELGEPVEEGTRGLLFDKPTAEAYSMIATDLNRDGSPDIVVGYVTAPGVVYFNERQGATFARVSFGDGKGTIYGMAAADLDGDGWPDIVAARSDAPSFVMFNRPAIDKMRK